MRTITNDQLKVMPNNNNSGIIEKRVVSAEIKLNKALARINRLRSELREVSDRLTTIEEDFGSKEELNDYCVVKLFGLRKSIDHLIFYKIQALRTSGTESQSESTSLPGRVEANYSNAILSEIQSTCAILKNLI